MEDVTLGLAFFAGLLSFVSPCVLPLVPAYIGYMGGRMTRNIALDTGDKRKHAQEQNAVAARAGMLLHGIMFVLGFTVVFVLIGLMTTAFVRIIGGSVTLLTTIIGRVGGIIIIAFGLHFMGALRYLFGWFKQRPAIISTPLFTIGILLLLIPLILWGFYSVIIALPVLVGVILAFVLGGAFSEPGAFWTRFMNTIENALYSDTRREIEAGKTSGLGGSFLMGVIFSAGWTPCIGPLLGTILTVAAQTGDVGVALPMLTAYSLGLGIPFLLTAGLLEGAQAILRRLQRYMHQIELASGTLLVIIGILVSTGSLASISQNLSPEQVDFSVRIEECGLGLFRGELTFEQSQACIAGNLRPVAFNQSIPGTISPDQPQMSFVFNIEQNQTVDIELNRLDAPFEAQFSLVDATGQVIATGDQLTLITENTYVALQAVALPAGRYTLLISGDEAAASFRFKVRESEPVESGSTGSVSSDITIAGGSVGQIEALAQQTASLIGLDIGQQAPDFTIMTIDGQQISLSSLRGKIVLVNFWGTWCGPCRREMPDLQSVYTQRIAQNDFTIVALATQPDTEAAVRGFQQEFGITFPLALDTNNEINDRYGIVSQPGTFILNQDGIIIHKQFGIITEQQITAILENTQTNS